jgi:exopolysaccharide biosynthesis polyprenyl glycosylphosphotransferase
VDLLVLSIGWVQTGNRLTWLACLWLWLVAAGPARLYASSLGPGFFARAAALARTLLLWVLLEAALSHMVPELAVDRGWLVAYAAGSAFGLLVLRLVHRVLLEVGLVVPRSRRILVVGDGEVARYVDRTIQLKYNWLGLSLIGHFSPTRLGGEKGQLSGLLEHVQREAVDEVLVVSDDCGDELAGNIVAELRWRGVRVSLVPSLNTLAAVRTTTEIVAGVPVLTVTTTALTGAQRLAKRALDLVVSAILLVLLASPMLLIALAIRLDSKGPALFSQLRVGEGGRTFQVRKFRTMCTDADAQLPTVMRLVGGKAVHKFRDDPRVTRVGRWLRASSLDELPQLINVLRGEMSLVGPRPELPWIVEQYEPWQYGRLAVPPGITGWWQLNGRSELPMHLNTEYDLFYVERYSLLLDVKLLVRTLLVPFYRRGAF